MLHFVVFWLCIAIAAVTLGALVFTLIRFYREPRNQSATTLKKDLLWSLLAVLMLLGLLLPITWHLLI